MNDPKRSSAGILTLMDVATWYWFMPTTDSCMEVHYSQKDGVAHHAPTLGSLIV